jgi:SAM-dependent methyltransferase
MAQRADRFALYERAVQDPPRHVRLLARHARLSLGRTPQLLREDFCGSAAIARQWIKRPGRLAVGVDHDPEALLHAIQRAERTLTRAQRQRLGLEIGDVRRVRETKLGHAVDVVCAFNFSYCVFKTEAALLGYLRAARRNLLPGGILMLDVWGGAQTQLLLVDRERLGAVFYVWDQVRFDPLTYHVDCRIHFEFKDGSLLRNAFVYDWRLWTPPELSRLVAAAGFADHYFLWQGLTPGGVGNGRFVRANRGHPDPAWIAYLVARAPRA